LDLIAGLIGGLVDAVGVSRPERRDLGGPM